MPEFTVLIEILSLFMLMTKPNDFTEFIVNSSLQDMDFLTFTKFIMQKNSLDKAKDFLSLFVKTPANPRILYSAFLIFYHHDSVLSREKNYLEQNVYQHSNIVVDVIVNGNLDNFHQIYLEWDKIFNYWKNLDKKDLLQQLSKYHCEVRKIYQDFNDKTLDSQQKGLLNKLENLATKIGGDDAIDHVKTSSKYGMVDNEILTRQISFNLKKIFWEEFQKDLSQDPPNFKQYPSLVKDIRDKFLEILPTLGKQITSQVIALNIDPKKTQQAILEKKYNLQDIYNLISFCLYKLIELHNKNTEDIIKSKITELDDMISNEKPCKVIPYFFEFILNQLEIISAYKEYFSKS